MSMLDIDLTHLDNNELVELLATFEGMDDTLCELEKLLKEGANNNEE